jgi:thiaminase
MDGTTPNPSLDLSALTPKQQDMALARNPMGGNELNANSMQTREINKQVDNQRKGVATQQQAQQSNLASPQAQGMQGGQAAGAAQRNLATFTNRIAAKLNQFVSGGDVSKLSLDLPAEFKPKWNATTKSFEMPDIDSARFSTDEIARLKAQQAEAIKGEMSPYFDYTDIGGVTNVRAKGFEDVLKQFADLNNDGIIDPQEQKFLDESFQIAQQIQRLDKIDPRSAEAKSLQMQLELADRDGLVSGIYRALDQYKRISGDDKKGPTLYSGIGGEDLNLENIVNMNVENIQQELLKALTGQESVFAGDFESALTSNRLRTNLEKAQAFRVETDTALAKAAEDWGVALDEQFSQQREMINTGFRDMYTDRIPQYFNKLKDEATARGESTAPLDAAMQWFDDLGKSNDPAQVIYDLINDPDSGLAVDQRKMLSTWLGEASGTPGMGQTGLIRSTLNSIAQKGFIDVSRTDAKGNPEQVVVEFNDRDRMNIAKLLADKSMTEEQRSAAVGTLIDRKISERLNASQDLATVQKYFTDGSFNAGLDAFADSLVKSLSTYNESATKYLYDKILEQRPGEFTDGVTEGGDPRDFVSPELVDSIVATGSAMAEQMASTISEVTEKILPEITKKKEQASADLAELDRVELLMNQAHENAIKSTAAQLVNSSISNGYAGFAELIMQGLKNQAVTANVNPANVDWGRLDPIVKTYTMLENIGSWLSSQGESYARMAIESSPMYQTYWRLLKDPMNWLKNIQPFSNGTIRPAALSQAQNLMNNLEQLLRSAAPDIVNKSPFNSAVESKRKAIDESRQRANDFLNEAVKYENMVQNYSANAQNIIESMKMFNPDDVAKMALRMGRAAEMGYKDPTQFIDMSKFNFTKEDFEKVMSGELKVRPLYAGSAVDPLSEGHRYEQLRGPGLNKELLEFGKPPTATPADENIDTSRSTDKIPESGLPRGGGYVSTGGQPASEYPVDNRTPKTSFDVDLGQGIRNVKDWLGFGSTDSTGTMSRQEWESQQNAKAVDDFFAGQAKMGTTGDSRNIFNRTYGHVANNFIKRLESNQINPQELAKYASHPAAYLSEPAKKTLEFAKMQEDIAARERMVNSLPTTSMRKMAIASINNAKAKLQALKTNYYSQLRGSYGLS